MTIRVDTLRNRVSSTVDLLAALAIELEDLHAIAYDRPKAAAEKVRGGIPDWALDNHGDMRARDAYRMLAEVTIGAVEALAVAAHDARRLLREGSLCYSRTRPSVSAREVAEAIEAQARRRARGEYSPVRHHPQTMPGA